MKSQHPHLLHIRAFRNLWLGQAISRFGDALYFIGFPFMVHAVTKDPAMVGFVGASEALPFLFLSAHAGTLADKLDRRKIMVLSDIASALILFAFLATVILAQGTPIWSFFLFGVLLSISRVYFMPARNASIPRLVPDDLLLKANSFSMMTDNIVWLGSMAVSAAVLSTLAALSPTNFAAGFILVDAVTFVGSWFFVRQLPSIIPDNSETTESTFQQIREGLRYARQNVVIWWTLIVQIGISLSIGPFFVVYIETNARWWQGKPETLALVEIGFVAALVVAGAIVSQVKIRRPGLPFSIGLGLLGVTIIFMGFSKPLGIFLFWNVLAGVCLGFVDPPMMTYTQMAVPDAFRGRIMSIKNLLMMGIQPIGMVLGGKLLKVYGIEFMYIAMGLGFAISGALPLTSREFRNVVMPNLATESTPDASEPESKVDEESKMALVE